MNQKDAEREGVHLMMQVLRAHRAQTEKTLCALPLNQSQHRLLMCLAGMEHTPAQNELAKRFGVSAAAMTLSLKKLEREGYIHRTVDDKDNRVHQITITEKGREIVEISRRFFTEMDAKVFAGFSGEELAQMRGFLCRMRQNLEAAEHPEKAAEQKHKQEIENQEETKS